MSEQPQRNEAPAGRPRRVMRRIRVTRVAQISPRMVRVTFTGDDLAAFGWNGPAAHIKLIFPEEGQTEPPVPQPDGPRPTRIRTYTPRRFDPSVPELDVEFVLHGEGPGSSWAAQAEPGQVLMLGGPGPNYQVAPDADWFLLAGDDTALPAIQTILEHLPASARAYVLMEVAEASEQRPLASPAQIEVTWLARTAKADAALEAAVQAFAFPAGTGRVYVGCEAQAMRRIRTFLLNERGFEQNAIVTRGYWKEETTNYTDHDYGQDDLA